MTRAVIFDLDGTLLSTFEDIHDALNEFLAGLGCAPMSHQRALEVIGFGGYEFISQSLPPELRDGDIAKHLTDYRDIYARLGSPKTRLFDGLDAVLDALTAAGVRMAILSNKGEPMVLDAVQRFLSRWHFDVVRGDRGGRIAPKPDPAATLEVLDQLGVQPDQAVFVGDGDTDVMTAVNVGMPCVAVLWGARPRALLASVGATEFASTPEELGQMILARD